MAQSVQVFCRRGSYHAWTGAAVPFALPLDHVVARADERPEDLKPLYRFFDKVRNHHIYTTDEQELADWRLDQNLKEQVIVGEVASTELPGTVRLWRAHAPRGWAPVLLHPGSRQSERGRCRQRKVSRLRLETGG
ncbi:hypothetical protein [Planctellipticum variicoloris]|uniref:hypothetical protein n=1 Tax=Planctellipticum variicoloris TaxID=3064265 RepID=UPI003AF5FDBA